MMIGGSVLSMGTAAWVLYDRATRIKTIGSWISYLLPQADPRIRQLLECLGRRVDTLCPALNYCLFWAHDKGSSVSDIVFQARDVLSKVEVYIHDCVLKQKSNEKWLFEQDTMLVTLRDHLHELDFAINSVNLAVTIINSTKDLFRPTLFVSPSALLRASDRIREMRETGGDLSLSSGSFYRCVKPEVVLIRHAFTSTVTPSEDAQRRPTSSTTPNSGTHRPSTRHSLGSNSGAEESWETIDGGMKANDESGWRCISESAWMKLYRNPHRNVYELHVQRNEDVAVRTVLDPPVAAAANTSVTRPFTSIFPLDNTSGFQQTSSRALGIQTAPYLSAVLDVAFTWVEMLSNQVKSRYAFVLHDTADQMLASGSLRPVDIAYTAKLCVYENEASQGGSKDKKRSGALQASAQPAHVTASDEELMVLLCGPASTATSGNRTADTMASPRPASSSQMPLDLQLAELSLARDRTTPTSRPRAMSPGYALDPSLFQFGSAGLDHTTSPFSGLAEDPAGRVPAARRAPEQDEKDDSEAPLASRQPVTALPAEDILSDVDVSATSPHEGSVELLDAPNDRTSGYQRAWKNVDPDPDDDETDFTVSGTNAPKRGTDKETDLTASMVDSVASSADDLVRDSAGKPADFSDDEDSDAGAPTA